MGDFGHGHGFFCSRHDANDVFVTMATLIALGKWGEESCLFALHDFVSMPIAYMHIFLLLKPL